MSLVEKLVGTNIQGWTLTNEIGRGADGVVYAADDSDGHQAAIKLFFPEVLKKNNLEAARERLDLQLTLIGKKQHRNLVEVYAGGAITELGTLFLLMELIPGNSLDKLIGRIPTASIVPLAGQLASAARFLDEKLDLVHRDIKPANIMIGDDFQTLTLLDFGIMHQLTAGDEQGRLSRQDFVATLRYSPPEFVWRTEDGATAEAWRAVTFYQIGATLHDIIMGKVLFAGCDSPRAWLYDAVRDCTPVIESDKVPSWLIQTVRACLLKDWRQRLQLVSWDGFFEPTNVLEIEQQEKRIRLRQFMIEEKRQYDAKKAKKTAAPTREQELWTLNEELIGELRNYLLNAPIFPRFSVKDIKEGPRALLNYITEFEFDQDLSRGFVSKIVFAVHLSVDGTITDATKLSVNVKSGSGVIQEFAWTEIFTVQAAFSRCQESLLSVLEGMLPA